MPLNLSTLSLTKSNLIDNFIKSPLSVLDKINLELQRAVSHLLFVVLGPVFSFIVFRKFKIRILELKAIRQKYRELLTNSDNGNNGPILICSNHLTYVDSIIQTIAVSSVFGHLLRPSRMAWHLPEKSNFAHKPLWRLICYLGKCIPVIRSGTKEETKRVTNKMQYVLGRGDVISIFPEGKRSKNGRLDTERFSYAVGQILKGHENCRVLCIFMRDKDKEHNAYSVFPRKDADYCFDMELLTPTSNMKGLRKAKDLSTQVMMKLKEMEDSFFSEK
ncbi:1-acyl-sn-glycerol-3-phosphate acyltransferase [bacterium]|nr:1-acyl-sn-glycerol-3-phosphate acyltransferase [bacterium]